MREIFRHLTVAARVLDLGARHGSFDAAAHPGRTYRVDLDRPVLPADGGNVQADAARLPFGDSSFDAVVSNHSMEHFSNLPAALAEVRRVLHPSGALFVAVPDAGALTDRIYRFFASGGGHLNAFRSADEVAASIGRETGLELRGTRTLFTSLSFLHPESRKGSRAGRMLPLRLTGEWTLRWAMGLFRWLDRRLGSRTSVYGWAFYFGEVEETIDPAPWTNVCVRCGSGHSSAMLKARGAIRQGWWLDRFRCLECDTWNFYTEDDDFRNVR